MENKLPPLPNLFPMSYASTQHGDRKEPHILFMPHDLSKRMRKELDKRNMTLEEFVMQSCTEYIKIIDDEQHDAVQSQSTSLYSINEDKELAEQMAHLQKLGVFSRIKKDAAPKPLIRSKNLTPKDSNHFEKK